MYYIQKTHSYYHTIIPSGNKVPRQSDRDMAAPALSLKDPASALTHLLALVCTILLAPALITKALMTGRTDAPAAMSVFMVSMALLYGASSAYHSFDISEEVNLFLKRLDHAMIFVLIAGSYTPVCLLVLPASKGLPLLVFVWAAALIGIIVKIFFIRCPKWVSSIIYIAIGWSCIPVFGPLMHLLSQTAFLWLLTGGIIYTIGGVIYSLKLPICDRLPEAFGMHEIFHLFVMGGSLCHYIFMYTII